MVKSRMALTRTRCFLTPRFPIRSAKAALHFGSRERRLLCRSRRNDSRRKQSAEESTPEGSTSELNTPASSSPEPIELSRDGKRMGWKFFPGEEEEPENESPEETSEDEVPFVVDLTNPGRVLEETSLPTVSSDKILTTCFSLSSGVFIASFLLRRTAERGLEVFGYDPVVMQSLLSLAPQWKLDHVGIAFLAAALVSGARLFLYNNWRDFAISTNRYNKQVLLPLNFGDIIFVSFISGISEEMLFRGGLIPASFPDWRGVVFASIIFGAFHKGAGRNYAFVVWASFVGCLYGFSFLLTQNIYVPIVAHSSANLFSALNWLSTQDDSLSES